MSECRNVSLWSKKNFHGNKIYISTYPKCVVLPVLAPPKYYHDLWSVFYTKDYKSISSCTTTIYLRYHWCFYNTFEMTQLELEDRSVVARCGWRSDCGYKRAARGILCSVGNVLCLDSINVNFLTEIWFYSLQDISHGRSWVKSVRSLHTISYKWMSAYNYLKT